MLRSESRPTAEMLDELDRLDAALAAKGDDVPSAPRGDARPGPTRSDASAGDAGPRGGHDPNAGDGAREETGGDALDLELRALVGDVRATRPALDAGARMRLEERVQAAKTAPAPRRTPRLTADRRWRAGIALAAIVVVALPVGAVVTRDGGSGDETTAVSASGEVDTTAAPTASRELQSLSGGGSGASATESTPSEATDAAGGPQAEPSSPADGAPGSSSGTSSSAADSASSASGGASESSSSGGSSGASRTSTKAAPLSATRRVIRDVRQTVRIEPGQVAAAAGRVTTIVQDAGGYLASSEVRERGSSAGGTFSVVVPTGRLDATVAALSRIGRPVRLERSATDVTDQVTSLDDRLADLRADRSAARLALARTVDPGRRAARRRALTLLSSRVAALQGERDDLRRRTSTSTIALRLTTTKAGGALPPPADDGSWGIGDAWRDAGRVLEVGGGVVLVGGVIVLPLLLLGGAALGLRRRTAARRGDALIDRS